MSTKRRVVIYDAVPQSAEREFAMVMWVDYQDLEARLAKHIELINLARSMIDRGIVSIDDQCEFRRLRSELIEEAPKP